MQIILNGSGTGKKPVAWSANYEIDDDTPEAIVDAIAVTALARATAPTMDEFAGIVAGFISSESGSASA